MRTNKILKKEKDVNGHKIFVHVSHVWTCICIYLCGWRMMTTKLILF